MTTHRVNVSSGSAFEAEIGYSRAVRTGPLVVVAGTTAPGPDVAAQAREAFRRIAIALGEVGASLGDVIRSKQAANRPKDQRVLPTLRELLAKK